MTPSIPPVADSFQARLDRLAASLPPSAAFADRVIARLAAEPLPSQSVRFPHFRSWIMKGSIGLAASVLLAVAAWSLLTATPHSAYAITDMPRRLLSLNSLHLKGTVYPSDGTPGRPIEIFAQQPDRIRFNGRIATTTQNGVTTITSSDMVISPQGLMILDTSTHRALVGPILPEDAKTQVGQLLQGIAPMLFTPSPDFKKVRSESSAGIATDVYECMTPDGRAEVWFNPATGLPVRTAFYQPAKQGGEHPSLVFDTIEGNPTINPAVFDLIAPPGYTLVKPTVATAPGTQQAAGPENFGSCQFNDMHIGVRFALNLGDDVLICWTFYDTRHPADDLALPNAQTPLTIRCGAGADYSERLLHADPTPQGFHWRWSVLSLAKPRAGLAGYLTLVSKSHGSTGSIGFLPLTPPPAELPTEVLNLQRQTMPPGQHPMTLDEIRQGK